MKPESRLRGTLRLPAFKEDVKVLSAVAHAAPPDLDRLQIVPLRAVPDRQGSGCDAQIGGGFHAGHEWFHRLMMCGVHSPLLGVIVMMIVGNCPCTAVHFSSLHVFQITRRKNECA